MSRSSASAARVPRRPSRPATTGAEVTIFDLASASGGSTALSSAEIYMGGNGGTRVQRACGFEDSTEDMYQYLMAANGPLADADKVRAYCEGSLDHFNWLVGLGVPYKDTLYNQRAIMALTDDCLLYTGSEKAWPYNQVARPCPRGHNLQVEGDNGGPLFMKIMAGECREARREDPLRSARPDADRRRRAPGARRGGAHRPAGALRARAPRRDPLRGRLRHEPGDAAQVLAAAARRHRADRQPGRHRLGHPDGHGGGRRRDQHARGLREPAVLSAVVAHLGHPGQRAGPAFRERGLLPRARAATTACSSRTGACT